MKPIRCLLRFCFPILAQYLHKFEALALLACLSMCVNVLRAQTDSLKHTRFVTRSLMMGGGYSNVLETYLSPLEYSGAGARVVFESVRNTRWMGGKLKAQHLLQLNYAYTHNMTSSAHIHYGLANYSYSLFCPFVLAEGMNLLVGPMVDVNAGAVYNKRNSNNPAQAKFYARLGASAMLVYRFHLGNYPLTARYQALLPLAGAMFSPEYGESYYELFSLGSNGKHVLFTSLHNNPSLRQMLTLDFPVGNVILRFGYLCDIQQAKVNNLKSHAYSHDFMIGFVRNIYIMKSKSHFKTNTKHIPF